MPTRTAVIRNNLPPPPPFSTKTSRKEKVKTLVTSVHSWSHELNCRARMNDRKIEGHNRIGRKQSEHLDLSDVLALGYKSGLVKTGSKPSDPGEGPSSQETQITITYVYNTMQLCFLSIYNAVLSCLRFFPFSSLHTLPFPLLYHWASPCFCLSKRDWRGPLGNLVQNLATNFHHPNELRKRSI